MATPESVPELAVSVNLIRSELERFIANTKKQGVNNYTQKYLKRRFESALEKYEKARSLHARIESLATPDERKMNYFSQKIFDSILNTYEEIEKYLDEQINSLDKSNENAQQQPAHQDVVMHEVGHIAQIKLPEINLPSFSGKYADWLPFKDQFDAIVHKRDDVPLIRKFQYLRSCLTGEALAVIQSYSLTAENYDAAWKSLQNNYQNERLIVSKLLSSITDIRPVSMDNLKGLKYMRNTVSVCINTMATLEYEISGPLLIHTLISKFDGAMRLKWESKVSDSPKYPTFAKLEKFLTDRIQTLESVSKQNVNKYYNKNQGQHNQNERIKVHNASVSQTPSCIFCKDTSHRISACTKFKELDHNHKEKFVKDNKLCYNCMRPKHMISQCMSSFRCLKCKGKHHTLLHKENPSEHSQVVTTETSTESLHVSASSTADECDVNEPKTANVSSAPASTKLLATAVVRLRAPNGRYVLATAMIDQGSEISFITERMVQFLQLKKDKIDLSITGIGSSEAQTAKSATRVDVEHHEKADKRIKMIAVVLKSVTTYKPKPFDITKFPQLANLKLASSPPVARSEIDLLIGVDFLPQVLGTEVIISKDKNLIAQSSLFGWIVSGNITNSQTMTTYSTNHCCQLEKTIQRFWEIENIPETKHDTPEESFCNNLFETTTTRDDSGRFIVKLPFKSDEITKSLGKSKYIAEASLNRILNKLNNDPLLKSMYIEFMDEYEKLNHMQELTLEEAQQADRAFFPHHPVLRMVDDKPKMRVVFNAAAKTSSGVTLNDTLYAGPKLQLDIEAILLNWRSYKFGFTTDVVKMFRQILIHPEDRKFQNIVWYDFEADRYRYMQLNTVTYGMTSSPYLSLRVLRAIADDVETDHPRVAEILRSSLFVDDMFCGSDSESDLISFRQELIDVLAKYKLELSKWLSNSKKLVTCSDDIKSFEDTENHAPKILGIFWRPKLDQFYISHDPEMPNVFTKRTLASMIAKIYDPMGWVSPITIKFKHLMQQLWLLKIDWDTTLPPQVILEWKKLVENLKGINNLVIPRWYGTGSHTRIELIGFSDASSLSFSSVLYLRVFDNNGDVQISNVMAKTRVSPLKTLSIPKLELCGAVLLTQLISYFLSKTKLKIDKIYCFSDSKVTLGWIAKHPSTWQVFVANRVSTIQTSLPQAIWSYIKSSENPADLNSRGVSVNDLIGSSLWWYGPEFLKSTDEIKVVNEFQTEIDKRKQSACHTINTETETDPFANYSTYRKIIRVYGYVFRFVNRTLHKVRQANEDILTISETQQAKIYVIKVIQKIAFQTEINELKNATLSSKSRLLSLSPYLDEDEILRVGGRLDRGPLSESRKHPIIIPKGSFAEKILRYYHLAGEHSGPTLTLALAREEFWVIDSRNTARKVIHNCVKCKRQRHKLAYQYMGDMPAIRSTKSRPFAYTGVDLTGHVMVRPSAGRGIRAHKCYIVVFICLATRAVHIDLVRGLDTTSFLSALQRFIARRSRPIKMFSDRGSNFVGGDNELQQAYEDACRDAETQNYLVEHNIEWEFIPPASPHHGGGWERAVRTLKSHLKPTMGNLTPTYDEMETMLCRIEACMNSRPLGRMSDDPRDRNILTPGHFLIGAPLCATADPSVLDLNENRLSRWQQMQKTIQLFWKRWSKEYISSLQTRPKWQEKMQNLQVNDIVLIRDENQPPCKWPLARIVKVHPGVDDLVRVVDVKTEKSYLTRPVTKLCPLLTPN